MPKGIRLYVREIARFLAAGSQQERDLRAAYAVAGALVAAAGLLKYVTGLTLVDSPFTLYLAAVVAAAARGGFSPAIVAVLASIVVAGASHGSTLTLAARAVFALEGVAAALIVSWLRSRLAALESRLQAAKATNAALLLRDRERRVLDAALRHLEDASPESAILVLNDSGAVMKWRQSAERMYGQPAENAVGAPATTLFYDELAPADLSRLLATAREEGSARGSGSHRGTGGVRLDVEFEIRPFDSPDIRGFTLAVHDTRRRREWDAYREAAARAQAALRQAADDTRQQLATLENLTDPSVDPLAGPAMVAELLERLRAALKADGVAFVQPGREAPGFVCARGLQPVAGQAGTPRLTLAPGRVAVVHNDPARLEQLSSLRWPPGLTSLLVVPVVRGGLVASSIEIVSTRPRQVSDWDAALARVVADRLAPVGAVAMQGRWLESKSKAS